MIFLWHFTKSFEKYCAGTHSALKLPAAGVPTLVTSAAAAEQLCDC